MAIKPKDIYDGRKKKRSWGTIITVSVLVLIALVLALFYGLRARCVYDEDGNAHIVFPFTQEAKTLREQRKQQEAEDAELTPPPISEDGILPEDGTDPEDGAQVGTPTDIVPEDAQPADGAQPEDGTQPADGTAPDGAVPDTP